jgi:hypothetical protein
MGIETGWTQSEFCCLKHTHRDSARVCKALQGGRREIGLEILQNRRPRAENFATPVENILVRQWNAMQWTGRCACSALAICFTGSLERCPGFDPYKTIQIPVYFMGTGDAGLCDLKRIYVAQLDQFSDLCNSKPGNFQLCHEMIPRFTC